MDFSARLKHAVNSGDLQTVRRILKGGVDVKSNAWVFFLKHI